MNEVQENKGNRVFWAGMILCTVYLSYRYPLQINSSGTSPTYSDTPLVLQLGKFLLVCPLFAIAGLRCFHKTIPFRHGLVAIAAVFLSSYSLLKAAGSDSTRALELSFWMLFSLALAWAVDSVSIEAIDRYLRFVLIYALCSTLVEVVLFAAFGRLPALAFGGTFLIRFGGFLDDPNGFAAILFLLLGWAYARYKGRQRFFVVGSLVIALLLTQSWTALAFFIMVAFLWALFGLSRRPLLAVPIACMCVLLIALVVRLLPESPGTFFMEMLSAKEGSIEGHSFPLSQWAFQWKDWIFLGDSTYNGYESWWVSAPINFGAPWFFVFLALIGQLMTSMRNALVKADSEARPVYLGFFLFGSYFIFGSLSLPFPAIFPVNVLFFVFSFLVVFGKIRLRGCITVAPEEA